ncbi:DUF1116 domain-containing protein [Caenimonas aquaedulcis]|uniref:DUF1116 domain-containing protein n=1 Tax=Caenimonas aquaedulcis TaxID=2793270 RepID=A0A931H7E2_9BURK|nr:DUF1116 domain-containing protein [Caenimonas aquaedulcis]MBG9390054.1 DUF1116 domain-containing protein [Caenimonas aquaedulcis]
MELKERIQAANAEALRRIVAADPVLVDVAPAGEVIPGLRDRMILHSGPPIDWNRMCGAQRGAAIGMCLFEGWARDAQEAGRLLAAGEIAFEPNHHHSAVGPMAGTITRNMWVWVVENRAFGNRAYCRQVESFQQFGDYSKDALAGLEKWRDVWGPALGAAVRRMGGIPLKPLVARALQMGDEMHNRVLASSSLFANAVAPELVQAGLPARQVTETMYYAGNHPFLFLGLSMAAAKASMDPARGIEASTVVTAMARNGTEFGIQVSGLEGEWFTAPSPRVQGLLLPGWKDDDAGLDMGDSAITETVGWGGFVIGGAPGILAFTGGTAAQALGYTRDMREITVGSSPDYLMPALDFAGAPVGIDIRKVADTGIVPVIDTAIAHREPGHGTLGGGIVRPPMACFHQALRRFGARYRQDATP